MIREFFCKNAVCRYQCKVIISGVSDFQVDLDKIKCPFAKQEVYPVWSEENNVPV
jgi:hypothetical protein